MKNIKFEYAFFVSYIIIGGLWILFSDLVLYSFFDDANLLSKAQTYKGWFYVLVTAVFFYFVLKKHLDKLRTAEQEAIKSDKLKTAFLQNISHEIRTPMNGIVGFADLLGEEDLSKEQRAEFLKIIARNSNQLLGIINDVLDVSLIETGNILAKESEVNINELLTELLDTFKPIIKPTLKMELQLALTDADSTILVDEVKLKQVLVNLLDNANKYTEEGFIEFGYQKKQTNLEFYVRDSGIGIETAKMEDIFERFVQASSEPKVLKRGVGLGLAICEGNVRILGGQLWVESEQGKGSAFYFTIPYKSIVSVL